MMIPEREYRFLDYLFCSNNNAVIIPILIIRSKTSNSSRNNSKLQTASFSTKTTEKGRRVKGIRWTWLIFMNFYANSLSVLKISTYPTKLPSHIFVAVERIVIREREKNISSVCCMFLFKGLLLCFFSHHLTWSCPIPKVILCCRHHCWCVLDCKGKKLYLLKIHACIIYHHHQENKCVMLRS